MSDPSRRRARRIATEAERALWHAALRDTKPLPGRSVPAAPAPQAAEAAKPEISPPQPRDGHGIDRRSAVRLRRGERPIEARLDLHGMTQAEAHAALIRFVEQAAADGLRTLLIITGKGARGGDADRGILQGAVPRWLAERRLSPLILATAAARPMHGGEGALYVLLRRRR